MDNHTTPLQVINNPFSYSEHDIRAALDETGNPWFCAKDIYGALGIVWKSKAGTLKNTPAKWIRTLITSGLNCTREAIYIAEPAVYQAIFRSNKAEAVEFTDWVCEEVLPALRRQGFYGQSTPGQQIQLRAQKIKLLECLSSKDAFIRKAVFTSLRAVCNQLGEAMPNPELLGKDAAQLSLEV